MISCQSGVGRFRHGLMIKFLEHAAGILYIVLLSGHQKVLHVTIILEASSHVRQMQIRQRSKWSDAYL